MVTRQRFAGPFVAGLLALSVAILPQPVEASDPVTSTARPLLTLIGELSYRVRIALPPAGTLEVSLSDGPDHVLARLQVELEGRQVPLPFRLMVPIDDIRKDKPYRLTASIRTAQGQMLWSADELVRLDPERNPVGLGLIDLTQVPSAAP